MECDNPNCQWRVAWFKDRKGKKELYAEIGRLTHKLLGVREELERCRRK